MTLAAQTGPTLMVFNQDGEKDVLFVRYLWERRRALITELREVEKLLNQPSSLKDKNER